MQDIIKAEYAKIWKTDTKMIDYCVKKITGIVQFEDSGYYCFEKPSIETRFCFGYGQNGISTEEDYENAAEEMRKASEKEVFFAENMRVFEALEEMINYDGIVYSVNRYDNPNVKLRSLTTDYEERKWGKIYGTVMSKITPVDRLMLKKELENQKKKFEKRLETYWKRFGASKLKTWTYLVD
jgi:uncharacterized protein (DUF1015 family)